MNKKSRYLILIIIIIGLLLSFFFPISFKEKLYDNKTINIKMHRKFGKCKTTLSVKKDINKDVLLDLKNEGFKLDKNKYKKIFVVNESCFKYKKKIKKVEFKLKNKQKIELSVFSKYSDKGYVSNISDFKIINNVNSEKLGKYTYIYKYNNGLFNKYFIRYVNVIDNENPKLTLKVKEKVYMYINTDYVDPGFDVSDNYDKDLFSKVKINGKVDNTKEGIYTLSYSVKDSSGNESKVKRKVIVKSSIKEDEITLPTYINGILIVNKKYGLPKDYNPGVDSEAYKALEKMQINARSKGLNLTLVSSFRSYETQRNLYNNYVSEYGLSDADIRSAKPGHSEHQTGLAFDVGSTKGIFGTTEESAWLNKNAHLYGFIIRYPYGKTNITGYMYEPWHIRYLGVDNATKVKESGLTLEEYLKIN